MFSGEDLSDYARAIYEHFVETRGKGVSLSSADAHLLLTWEAEDVPLHVVLLGVDRAFDRKAEPPKSLKECKRFVTHELKAWRTSESEDAEAATPTPSSPPAGATPSPRQIQAPELLEERLERGANAVRHEGICGVLQAISAELAAFRAAEGTIPADVIAVVEEGIISDAIPTLSSGERSALDAHVEDALHARRRQSPMSPEASKKYRLRVTREWLEDRYGAWERSA